MCIQMTTQHGLCYDYQLNKCKHRYSQLRVHCRKQKVASHTCVTCWLKSIKSRAAYPIKLIDKRCLYTSVQANVTSSSDNDKDKLIKLLFFGQFFSTTHREKHYEDEYKVSHEIISDKMPFKCLSTLY